MGISSHRATRLALRFAAASHWQPPAISMPTARAQFPHPSFLVSYLETMIPCLSASMRPCLLQVLHLSHIIRRMPDVTYNIRSLQSRHNR